MIRRRSFALVLTAIVAAACAYPSSWARAAEPQKLFALDAQHGTLTSIKGRPGVHRLVLERVRARALYFTDRPAREVGTVGVRSMLRALFAGDSPAPNAAVNATAPKRGQLLMGVELRAWRYDLRTRRLTLRVRHLRGRGRTLGRLRDDAVLPRAFRDVSVFIDDCCDASSPATVFNSGVLDFVLQVNNGPQVAVPGALPPGWLPGSAPIGFSQSGPQPGVLGPGANFVDVTPEGSVEPFEFTVELPASVPYTSVQLYIFLNDFGSITWVLLDNGELVTSAQTTRLPALAAAAAN